MDIRTGRIRRNKEKREKVLEEEREGYSHKTEAESSESEAEAMMIRTFQIGEKRQLKRPRKDGLGTKQDTRYKESARQKKLTDEVMMNIACDDIATETTAAALRGEEPYSDTVMELPYARDCGQCYI